MLGVVSLVVLCVALVALKKGWTKTYIGTASFAEFANVLVLVAQSFQKVPALHAHAPTGHEPIIAVLQGAAFVMFGVLAVVAIRKKAFVLA